MQKSQGRVWRGPAVAVAILGMFVAGQAIHADSPGMEQELAELDAVATMLGSIRSWIGNEREAAMNAFAQYDHVRRYLDGKLKLYADQSARVGRIRDRVAALERGIKDWEQTVPKYQTDQSKQIATELKRQRDAVERYKKSKSPRPSSFAYIPKTVWQTKDKLDVLTASGVDTKDLRAEQAEVQRMVLELLASLDADEIAKKNGYVRDGYKQSDRNQIEQFVRSVWPKVGSSGAIKQVIMPDQSWSNTYSARLDVSSSRIVPFEVERMTVYVATERTEEIRTLHPIRLMREHYRGSGKRMGSVTPGAIQMIETNEFPFDVFAKNIR